jgi:hypothetical protein
MYIGGLEVAVSNAALVKVANGRQELFPNPQEFRRRELRRLVVLQEIFSAAVFKNHEHVACQVIWEEDEFSNNPVQLNAGGCTREISAMRNKEGNARTAAAGAAAEHARDTGVAQPRQRRSFALQRFFRSFADRMLGDDHDRAPGASEGAVRRAGRELEQAFEDGTAAPTARHRVRVQSQRGLGDLRHGKLRTEAC